MASFDRRAALRLIAPLLWVAACQGGASCNRDGADQASTAAEQEVSGDMGDGIYEVIPRGPFHLDEDLKVDAREPAPATPKAPTVVLAVLDTVRADHTSLCGYSRKTTAYLEALKERGAVYSCRAYTPGDWSLPTHASYFTGVSVARHGAHYAHDAKDENGERIRSLYVYPLREDVRTLAEEMRDRGYQTVLVSDNGLLGEAGLQRGFSVVATRPRKHDPRADWVPPTLLRVLAEEVDPSKPLFLVLNYLQAHDPWVAPDLSLDWDLLDPQMAPADFKSGFRRFLRAGLKPGDERLLRRQLTDLYDYGVYREDQALQRSLSTLERAGWLRAGFRIGITADHGEMLMEHGMWRHLFVYEGNTRVPFLYWTDGDSPSLPEPFPAIAVHSLLRDGRLPDPMPAVASVAIPNPDAGRRKGPGSMPAVAMWFGDEKLVWIGGTYMRIDLVEDPDELAPKPLGNHPKRSELEALVAAIEAGKDRRGEVDPALVEQLRALGYVE
ncbi:MAG: sulfatase-like hydrolase/transferase [Myxococcales bacterium]|nr:sulfatase-like hydrolase/transferase [Myxococcales bacterium]